MTFCKSILRLVIVAVAIAGSHSYAAITALDKISEGVSDITISSTSLASGIEDNADLIAANSSDISDNADDIAALKSSVTTINSDLASLASNSGNFTSVGSISVSRYNNTSTYTKSLSVPSSAEWIYVSYKLVDGSNTVNDTVTVPYFGSKTVSTSYTSTTAYSNSNDGSGTRINGTGVSKVIISGGKVKVYTTSSYRYMTTSSKASVYYR